MNRYIDYEPIPFYFLNDTFNREEIVRQLNIMKEKGIASFFLHVRDGILDEAYGTAMFFENMRFVADEAAQRGLCVWLYDEDSFPSGNAGGLIAIENPELQAYSLKVDKLRPEEVSNGVARRVLGKVKGLFGYAVYRDNEREISKKLTNCFGVVRRRWYRRDMDKTYYCDMQNKLFFPHVRAGTSYSEIMFEAKTEGEPDVYVAYLEPVFTDSRYGLQADCLNRRTTEKFISKTHEKYFEYMGDYFGNVIPGIFMDEPSAGGILPYTEELSDRFKKLWGYDVTDFYYRLSSDYTGDGKALRREYIETVQNLFLGNFIAPIADWCKERNLLLTGHFYGEEDPLSGALCAQSVYRQVKQMGMPGFDVIGRYVGDREHCALILGAKIVVSSATQNGKDKILAECFALNPFNFGYDGLRKTGDWLFACGINRLAPHAFHYGYSAYQRTDAGKSFFYQDRLFPEYLRFSEYAGRIGKLLSEYRHESRVLMVLPSGGFAEEVPFSVCNTGVYPGKRAIEMQNLCYGAVRYFIENQIEWDVTETPFALNACICDGKAAIEHSVYDKVIFIKGGETENDAYLRMKNAGIDCLMFDGANFENFPKAYGLTGDYKDILMYKKYGKSGELIFLYQNACRFAEIGIPVDKPVWVYDGEKDELKKVDVKNGYVRAGIKGYGSLLLLTGTPPAVPVAGRYFYEREGDRILECEERPQWHYLPPKAEYAIIAYDIEAIAGDRTKKFKNHEYSRLRDLIGTQDRIYAKNYVIPYFDTAPRPENIYPCKAVFRASVPHIKDCEYLLYDGGTFSGNYKLKWNGKEIDCSEIENIAVYDAKNYIFKPKWNTDENILEVVFESAEEFDGINGEIYLYKK